MSYKVRFSTCTTKISCNAHFDATSLDGDTSHEIARELSHVPGAVCLSTISTDRYRVLIPYSVLRYVDRSNARVGWGTSADGVSLAATRNTAGTLQRNYEALRNEQLSCKMLTWVTRHAMSRNYDFTSRVACRADNGIIKSSPQRKNHEQLSSRAFPLNLPSSFRKLVSK